MSFTSHFLFLLLAYLTSQSNGSSDDGRAPPCQLPPFTNLLSLNSRRELRKIWAGFHSSTSAKKCERQLAQTKELIAGLAEDMKMKILDYDRPTVSPVEERRGTNFLAGLSEEQTKMFSGIMSNRSITHDMRYDLLRNWASEHLDLDAMNQVEQFISFQQRKNKSFKLKVDNLSSEARIAHDRLESLRLLKQDVYSNLSESARKELAGLYRAKCPRGSIYEASDLDAEEIQLACSVDDRIPLFRTTTTTHSSLTAVPGTTEETSTEPETTTTSTTTTEPTTTTSTTTQTTTTVPTSTSTISTTSTTTTTPTTTTTTTSTTTSDDLLWVKITTTPPPPDTTEGRLSFEIEKSNNTVPLIPSRPHKVASMFVADPEKLTDLLKQIFGHKNND
ncbi:uncharacterized protein CELE_K07D4.6 [Caenorhabditis elegans]|uniref:Uncharacterized protein n=1 Tax=Caenorhabditis elegans TaxID=6239 RepID=O76573_CAEEL|nr:Uncharacterized protein CELE_K07D4.6 [Caenorhabditis elegans]CCD72748.1 Uncharacterized protein CELE_K07D4.6 [Caenorhabditis elegans]|eukprot:NP_494708.1 Uncharacterized protein CELE_K07D4.6 [Caenorhabditis elegans]